MCINSKSSILKDPGMFQDIGKRHPFLRILIQKPLDEFLRLRRNLELVINMTLFTIRTPREDGI